MKRKAVIIISLCCIIAAIVLAVLISRSRSRLSVFGNSTYEAPNVDFTVQLKPDERRLLCVITNNNDDNIYYDSPYYLEKERCGKWYDVTDIYCERGTVVLAVKIPIFQHGGKDAFSILLKDSKPLPKGNYRVARRTSIGPIFAYFQVE
mgnify:CR=1 FL=1|jgi:hypothetical protein